MMMNFIEHRATTARPFTLVYAGQVATEPSLVMNVPLQM